jgi:hypothetical protein
MINGLQVNALSWQCMFYLNSIHVLQRDWRTVHTLVSLPDEVQGSFFALEILQLPTAGNKHNYVRHYVSVDRLKMQKSKHACKLIIDVS